MAAQMSAFVIIIEKATDLRAADSGMFAKSDPYVHISTPTAPTAMCENEKTKVIEGNLNPVWMEAFLVSFPIGVPPIIKLEVFDRDAGTFVDGSDDFLGRVQFDLGALASSDAWRSETTALSGVAKGGQAAKGTVTISVRLYADPVIQVKRGIKLRNADGFFGKSDPFVRLQGLLGTSANWGETKTVRDSLDPVWDQSFRIPLLSKMPMGGKLLPLHVGVFDEDDKKRGSADDFLGHAEVAWKDLWPNLAALGTDKTLALHGEGSKGGSSVVVAVALEEHAATGEPAAAPFKVPKAACKAVLSKGHGHKIADCTDKIDDNFMFGLSWDVTGGQAIDLDASCVFLDASLNMIDEVWFRELRSKDGSMQHMGDEREGDAVGDDEKIQFNLDRVSREATYLCFTINSFSGQELNDVKSASCRLYNSGTKEELSSYNLSSDKLLNCTALLMAVLYRGGGGAGGDSEWYCHAVGESANGRTVNDNVDEWQAFLRKKPLSTMHDSRKSTSGQTVMLKVPDKLSPNGTIGFKSPGGGEQQLKIQASCAAGDVIEVPIIDIYVAM
jgi:tellurium resistance protein TerZ